MIKKYLSALTDLVLPNRCVHCKSIVTQGLCDKCLKQVVYIKDNICPICGKPHNEEHNLLCSGCREQKPEYLLCRSAFEYDGPIKEALHHLKFEGRTDLAGPLAKLLLEYLDKHCPELKYSSPHQVIGVPLSPKRERSRGFNQADIFAEALSKRLAIPNGADILIRVKETKPQFNLDRKDRLHNISGAFKVKHPHKVSGQRFLLVDDIYTTGSTTLECTRVLLEAGAKNVSVLTLARSKD
jgi:ComF family protein